MRSVVGKILRKLGMKEFVISALNKVGIGGFNTGNKLLDIKLLIERSPASSLKNSKFKTRKVVFAGVMPGMTEHSVTSGVMGAALRLHGAEVSYYLCDGVFSACELLHFTHYKGGDKEFLASDSIPVCNNCFTPSNNIYEMLKFHVVRASTAKVSGEDKSFFDALEKLSIEEVFNYKYNGLDIGEHVRTSVHRFYMKGILDFDEQTRMVAVKYLKSGIEYANSLTAYLKKENAEVLICPQGIYLFGGIASEVCQKNNIRFYAWDYSYRKNGIYISEGMTYHHELRLEPNKHWEELVMDEKRNRILDEYFSSRKEGRLDKDEISYTSNSLLDERKITEKLGIDKTKKIVAFFTNVPWDGKVAVASNLFDGPAEMILESIEHLQNRDDIQVVVRIHPAEVLMKQWVGLQRMDTLIAEKFPTLPKNVIVIPPEEKISSYGLAAFSDIAVVYSTKLGLEVMLMGKQVLMGGDAFYQNKGFGLQPKEKQEFWDVFNNLDKVGPVAGEELERVRKYAYHFFYRRTIEIPTLYKNTPDSITISDLSMLAPGRSKEVDRFCDSVITGRPFHINAE